MFVESTRRIVVVGGGIAGLTAAYRLGQARRRGVPIEEVLLEAGDRLGGVIRTDRAEGCVIEAGPDSFLAEKPEAATLARELGLGDSLLGSNDAARRTYVLHKGRLEPLPTGLMLMVPARLGPIVRTPLVPLAGKLTIAREWLTGRAPGGPAPDDDEPVARFVTRHFGAGMLRNIVEPLLAGVYGGDSGALSTESVFRRFQQMERQHGSLVRAVRALRRETRGANPGSIFMSLREGLGSLVDALAREIEPERVELGRRVVRIEGQGSRDAEACGYRVVLEDGSSRTADSVVLAVPAWAAAALAAPLDTALADQLAAIPYTSAVTVALVYGRRVRAALPRGFGFLVPRSEGRRLLACTFVHAKFEERAPEDRALLRTFLGGVDDAGLLAADDQEILRVVRAELRSILGVSDEPLWAHVYRWPRSMAQYVVGHQQRLRAIADRLQRLPGLCLAGNAYSGIGLPDAIRTGEDAARALCAGLVRESVAAP